MAESRQRPLVAGNWKMNGLRADGRKLAADLAAWSKRAGAQGTDILICPPTTLLEAIRPELAGSPVQLGAQDCHWAKSGAHTGNVSAEMLADQGCSFVIVGHSERRAGHGETDEIVKSKAEAALRAGLVAIVCIGETDAERKAGRTIDVVTAQCKASLPEGAAAGNTVVAYEPVWAIGSGRVPTNDEVAAVHSQLRRLALESIADGAVARLLYGGSVKTSNAKELLAIPEVNGALVGGASLKLEEFTGVIQSCP
ncbi:MAG: triose-phosphate isomerase [Dongiaceae bacterium]